MVFYNGREAQPEKFELRLSDSYIKPSEKPELELICTVYNINPGYNEELMKNCSFLNEYMQYVEITEAYVKRYGKQKLDEAIRDAIDECITRDILREFLKERRTEVEKVMRLDYTFERQIELEKRDSYDDGYMCGREEGDAAGHARGRAEGRLEERIQQTVAKLKKNKSLLQMADELETDISEIEQIYNVAVKYAPDYDVDEILKEIKQ